MQSGKSSRVTTVGRKSAYRPRIESLEDRRLMAVITVTGTGDAISATDHVVTLREAITAANDNKNISDVVGVGAYGNDTIDFDIPGTGVQTIRPTSALPIITDPVTIDGYTQPGSAPNTNPVGQGLNGRLLIEIDGENAGDVRFGILEIQTTDSVVRGLVINRTQGEKIGIDSVGTAGDILIEGDYIGTDATGTAGFAASPNPNSNARDGISIGSRGNTIGGTTPAARNLISGNIGSLQVSYGVNDNSSSPLRIANFVQGNLIGTDRTGTVALGNGSGGVAGGSGLAGVGKLVVGGPEAGAGNLISGNGGIGVHIINGVVQGNLIGTDVTGTLPLGNATGVQALGNVVVEHNTIAFNTVAGVQFTDINDVPTAGNLITQNSIFSNFGPGIGTSSYLNDSPDADGIQNYPTLASVMPNGAGTQAQGTLASKPSSKYRLEFFASAERQEDVHDVSNFTIPGEFAEGRTYLGTINVTTNTNGTASFTADLPALPAGEPYVTATATDITDDGSGPRNNTSPFSAVAVLGGPSFVVTNTNDSGLGSLREAIYNANLTPGPQTITFAIPATDARHFYYRNDGVAGTVSQADIAVTTASSDANIAGIDPDWAHSWFSILPSHALPLITDTVTINGYSQAGAVTNSLSPLQGLNTVLKIELDGANVSGDGLSLGIGIVSGTQQLVTDSAIQGLAINRFGGNGISLDSFGGNTIGGDFIGTDVSGTLGLPNGLNGVFCNTDNNSTIGGLTPGSDNLISANGSNGIELSDAFNITIEGNLIGTDRRSQPVLVNVADGILIVGLAYDTVGGAGPSAGNTIAFGTGDGIATGDSISMAIQPAAANLEADATIAPSVTFEDCDQLYNIAKQAQASLDKMLIPTQAARTLAAHAWQNFKDCVMMLSPADSLEEQSFNVGIDPHDVFIAILAKHSSSFRAFSVNPSGGLAIDLGNDGVTLNEPVGGTPGPSYLQNFPILTSANTANGATTISGTLTSAPSQDYRVDLYANAQLTPSGYGPGESFLGSTIVRTDSNGNASFTFQSPTAVPAGQFITSLATFLITDNADPLAPKDPLQTSEFSAGVEVGTASTPPPPLDTVGPIITNLLAPSPKTKGTPLVLTFSEDLDLARATNLVNYLLVTAGRDKKFGTRDDKKVALRSASYNPTTHTVTLLPRKKLAASVKYRLNVNGTSASGVEDLAGNLLNANHDGLASGNYVDIFKLVRPKPRRRS